MDNRKRINKDLLDKLTQIDHNINVAIGILLHNYEKNKAELLQQIVEQIVKAEMQHHKIDYTELSQLIREEIKRIMQYK